MAGGTVLITGGPQFEPSGNTIRRNVPSRKQPFDISWDGAGSGVVLKGNRCVISQPQACATDLILAWALSQRPDQGPGAALRRRPWSQRPGRFVIHVEH